MNKNNIITPKILKGFRDLSTKDMLKRSYLLDILTNIVKSHGFDQIETPTLEYEEVLLGNIGEDEKLIYRFTDNGGRKVAMRYDQTLGASRYIAMNYNQIAMPLKRYQISNVFRAENTQKGRLREFLQFDADIFGVDSVGADIEMIALTCEIYEKLGLKDFKVFLSDRSLLKDIPYTILASIDKLDKIGIDLVEKEIKDKGFDNPKKYIESVMALEPSNRIIEIINAIEALGHKGNLIFEPTLMRSFSYSSGLIWEVKVPGYNGSLLGGERFDALVSRFSKYNVPGIGFGIGFDRTLMMMEERNLLPENKTNSVIMIAVKDAKCIAQYLNCAKYLRERNLNCEVYTNYEEEFSKQLKYADKKGIPWVIYFTAEELKSNNIPEDIYMKNMESGEILNIKLDKVTDYI